MHRPDKALVACIVMASCACPPPSTGAPQGLLGHRIGTLLRLEGQRAEEGKVGSHTLLVDRANGSALAQPVAIWVENLQFARGERCAVSGYESARWIGLPPEVERIEGLEPRQAMWQMQRFFIVTSVQSPPELVQQFAKPR